MARRWFPNLIGNQEETAYTATVFFSNAEPLVLSPLRSKDVSELRYSNARWLDLTQVDEQGETTNYRVQLQNVTYMQIKKGVME
ncbi:hypothetical protein HCA69_15620 [Listeria grandensis]|uniref:Uncharacterized protein n=1 Tax=Listeria grandensis TaxID=1494963 RepID=A0A7X0Y6L1_9LIST|nr:hypothetical protein [Listeria grandensis]MBC1937798.1 hypothetical protein [Listeria grandensis]